MKTIVATVLLLGSLTAAAAAPPEATISSKQVKATLMLPDRDSGYYRGVRFDWSGVISKLEYAGHSFFGVWFPEYDPYLHDAITGPVDEFRSDDGALGFAEAAPNDMFIKIGVGVLRKPDDKPYSFVRPYQMVSEGHWIVRPYPDRVEFVQELKGIRNYAYVYSKTVKLDGKKPVLTLEHKLKNTGKRAIDTEVYNHDFYVIDNQPTSPNTVVKFAFTPVAKDDLKGAATLEGNELHYTRELQPKRDSVASYMTGYSPSPKDNDVSVENRKTGAGIREIGNRPISKFYLWSIRTTVCPEAYIKLHIPPGKTMSWKIDYHFYTLPPK